MSEALDILLPVVIILVCVLIGRHDFVYRKILNRHVGLILSIAVIYRLSQAGSLDLARLDLPAFAIAAIVFVVGIVFWSMGRMGAGDVKFLAVTPLLTGTGDYFLFLALTVLFSVVTHVLMNYPILMPEALYKRYVENYSDGKLIPYGLPIAASVSTVMLVHLLRRSGLL